MLIKMRIKKSNVDNLVLAGLLIAAALVVFNQVQLSQISSSIAMPKMSAGSAKVSGIDVSESSSTAMSLALVFPELKNAETEAEIAAILLPSGTPDYSAALGGISFDDPINSLDYLSQWYSRINEEVKKNDPLVWQRYLNLAAAPRGISCEYCCGVGPQGIDSQGNSRCGCQHNPALLAITLGLMKYTDYDDAQVLREVMRWKTLFFPQNMVSLGVEVAGKDVSQLAGLPGMVGGC